ncbi:hypothetical protein MTYP_01024 [Methylophilaceae bacterium]|nr:hypothetical protein MTYP_01024 [Methylophilaceae bacterium]
MQLPLACFNGRMNQRPTPLLSLSPCGRRFILRCPHCGINREEPVDPTRNPYPFSYLSNCSSCHTRLHVDHQQIAGIQHSYARAKGVTPFGAIPAPVKGITTAVSQQAGNTSATRVVPAIDGAKAPIADAEKIPATVAMAGNEGGESQCTGSPAYLALNRASAAVAKVVRPSVLRFEGSLPNLFTKGLTMTKEATIKISDFSREFGAAAVISSLLVQALAKQPGFDRANFVADLQNGLSSLRLSNPADQAQVEKCVEILKLSAGDF